MDIKNSKVNFLIIVVFIKLVNEIQYGHLLRGTKVRIFKFMTIKKMHFIDKNASFLDKSIIIEFFIELT